MCFVTCILWILYEYHVNYKMKIFWVIKDHIRPYLCWTLSLEQSTYFKHKIQFFFNTLLVYVLKFTPNHTPLKYRCMFNIPQSIWEPGGGGPQRKEVRTNGPTYLCMLETIVFEMPLICSMHLFMTMYQNRSIS